MAKIPPRPITIKKIIHEYKKNNFSHNYEND